MIMDNESMIINIDIELIIMDNDLMIMDIG